jgi:hypothetical protein
MANASLRRTLGRALLLTPPTADRVVRFVAAAWLLALAGIWASQQVHAGLHEHLELSPLLHLVRDSALAVPLAGLAIVLAGLVNGELIRSLGLRPDSLAAALAWAAVAALVFAALSVPGNELHGLLFGAEEEEGSLVADLLLDAGVVLASSLLFLAPAAAIRLAPWPPAPSEDHPPRRTAAHAPADLPNHRRSVP